MKRRFRAPTPALVISLIALFVALGGTSYAATTLAKNSVGAKQLKKNAVTTVKIKKGAVTAAKINTKGLTVPTATSATNATNATNATTVGGQTIKGFHLTVATGVTAQQTVLSLNGLTLTLSCGTGEPTIQATAGQTGAFMRGMKTPVVGGIAAIGTSNATAASPVTIFTTTDKRGIFTLDYLQTDGHRVDVYGDVDDTATINDFNGCLLEGTAIAG
jgi:predicted secreted protein